MNFLIKTFLLKRNYAILIALIAWFAICLQFSISNEKILNFFSYFTILSALLIAISLTTSLIKPSSRVGAYFDRFSVQTAITLYILIVFLIYNFVIRRNWTQTVWQFMADNLLHVAIPILYIIYWLLIIPRGILNWKNIFAWLYFPAIYLCYTLLRGALTYWYPYSFLNAIRLGYAKVFLNIVILIAVFMITGLLLVFINRLLKRK
jgi:hypothetical protein